MPTKKANAKSVRAHHMISVIDYSPKHLEEKSVRKLSECVHYKDTTDVTWINIDNVPPLKFLQELGLGFNLHPVILEDITNPNQRPKAEVLDNYVYIVLKMLIPAEGGCTGKNCGGSSFFSEQVSIVVASKFLITLQQGIRGDAFDYARNLIRKEKTHIRHAGTDYLAYELINDVTTSYFKVLEDLGERIERLEDDLMKKPSSQTLNGIYSLKRDILEIRKAVWPLREVVDCLERENSPLIKKSTLIYLRDIYARVTQVIDILETYKDTVSGMLDIYLSSVSNRMNGVMKTLTIITTVFMPLTFLTGLYGMNFRYMPGLEDSFGFWVMAVIMLLVALGMVRYIKRKKWL